MSKNNFYCIDLFAGAGGLSEGLTEAGIDVAVAVELNPHASATYELNHPSATLLTKNMQKISSNEIKDAVSSKIDIVVGGPPCQGVSYARSRDLLNWEDSNGRPIALPITISNGEIVDPVPVNGGLFNDVQISFDAQNRVIISYQKYDQNGHNQIYNARKEDSGWKIYQTASWNSRWEISGCGSINKKINFGGIIAREDGSLSQYYSHWLNGSGIWKLNSSNLRPIGMYPPDNDSIPPKLKTVTSVNLIETANAILSIPSYTGPDPAPRAIFRFANNDKNSSYVIRWEAFTSPNNDVPWPLTPLPTLLECYELQK